ncbi:EXS family-domain-containing protein [Catenaria anguillulae PL171]|uniref:EXS family-domain-containing protein n=1 Tax=Catenaria anguillulae PL171 TaxID=765915 RepID=A0A1Y2HL61_9FUNG|nr:EXS family-domain-containing protein [Catenaria anguillulae PL171]
MCVISASFKWRSSQEEEEWLIVWVLLSICATVYAVSWDMFFDWGLMDPEHKLLRSELVFPSNAMYYFALVTNSLLRLGWVIQISPGHWFPTVPSSAIALVLAILEILRRVQWCLYRMENEHLSNCGQFRATKEIPLPRVHHPSDEDDDLEAHGRHDESGSSSDGTRGGGSGGVIRMLRLNNRAARERSQSRSRSPSPEGVLEEVRRAG